jgi:CRP-like cAMP-binding protein
MHMSLEAAFSPAAFVGHAGYILLVLSMIMTQMLWLRIIAIGAGILQAIYYGVFLHDPVGTFWETIFTLTNVAQLAIIAYRNRAARFTADERAFYETAVPTLEAADARKLIAAGRWTTAEPGTILTREGEDAPVLAFIVAGEVDVSVNGRKVGECGPGSFVGEISVSSKMPASATATVRTPIRYLGFDRAVIVQLLDKHGDIGVALELAFRHGLRDKLLRTNVAILATPTAPVTP